MNLKNKSLSDLAWELVPYYAKKAEEKKISDISKIDRFTKPSKVSQKAFLNVEKIFQDYLTEIEFVELSPLQPLGLNCVLANTNGKKLIPTIRGQEVNSDATTALFLEACRRLSKDSDIRIATNVRTVRPKIFSDESKFLSHFKVFAEVSVGWQASPFGMKEIDTIVNHLISELTILNLIRENIPNNITHFNVYISNLSLLRDMLDSTTYYEDGKNLVDAAKILWESSNMPAILELNSKTMEELQKYGFKKGMKILNMFLGSLTKQIASQEAVNWFYDLSRSAGINYYRHIAYKITAVSNDGSELPLADGGSNDWGCKMFGNKQIYTVSSGVGTELLIQNYLKLA